MPLGAHAEERLSLLIGNQSYSDKIGPLKNPHNDIALVGAALEKLGFKVTSVRDAGYKAIDTALKRHIQQVRHAGKDTISFVYYSGHGAADPDTQINYLIPVDVSSADDAEVWTNSIDLKEIVSRLRDQTPDAVHYIIFDACREELRLTRDGTKALERKGFVPVTNISGVMIAYATAPGKTASDGGYGGGVYAKTLAEEIVKPGVESVMMFRNVQLKVKETIGQDPWLSFPTLPAVYFAGTRPALLTPEQQLELTVWLSVKDSKSPAVLATYLKRYPNGEFAAIARAQADHYDHMLKAEQAAQAEERKRLEEEQKAAKVLRLEEERQARETLLAQARKSAEVTNNATQLRLLEEQQRKELVERTAELHNALEAARLAREATKRAEDERMAAINAAEQAKRRADQAELVRAVQTELKRMGCDPGNVDGVWDYKAKRALAEFARLSKVTLPNEAPTSEALQAVLGQKGRICAAPKVADEQVPRKPTRRVAGEGEGKKCGFGFVTGGAGHLPAYRCQ